MLPAPAADNNILLPPEKIIFVCQTYRHYCYNTQFPTFLQVVFLYFSNFNTFLYQFLSLSDLLPYSLIFSVYIPHNSLHQGHF